jgi:tetratricopeptide (TPR) repeat protein
MVKLSLDEVEARTRRAFALLDGSDDDYGLLVIWDGFANVANARCHLEEWARAAEQVMYHAKQIGLPLFALWEYAAALWSGPRPADEVQQILEPYLAANPEPYWRLWYATVLAQLGRFDEAWVLAEQEGRRLDELGNRDHVNIVRAEIAMLAGDYEDAVRRFRAFCGALEQHGSSGPLSTYLPRLGRCLCMVGRHEEAEPLAQRARSLGELAGGQDMATEIFWRQALALVWSHRGQHEEAERLAREAVALAEQTDSLNMQGETLYDLAEVLERAGRPDEAVDVLHQALERYERKKNLAMAVQVTERLEALVTAARET